MPTPKTLPVSTPVAFDPDGHQVLNRTPIGQANAGGTSAGPNATTVLTNVPAVGEIHVIFHIRLECTTAPTADGALSIQDTNGNVIVLIDAATTHTKGQVLDVVFAVPRPTANSAVAIQVVTPANTGTWRYFVDGLTINAAVLS